MLSGGVERPHDTITTGKQYDMERFFHFLNVFNRQKKKDSNTIFCRYK